MRPAGALGSLPRYRSFCHIGLPSAFLWIGPSLRLPSPVFRIRPEGPQLFRLPGDDFRRPRVFPTLADAESVAMIGL
jgi:hypothetical protein